MRNTDMELITEMNSVLKCVSSINMVSRNHRWHRANYSQMKSFPVKKASSEKYKNLIAAHQNFIAPRKYFAGNQLIAEKYNIKFINKTIDNVPIYIHGHVNIGAMTDVKEKIMEPNVEKITSFILEKKTALVVGRNLWEEIVEPVTKKELIEEMNSELTDIGLGIRSQNLEIEDYNGYIIKKRSRIFSVAMIAAAMLAVIYAIISDDDDLGLFVGIFCVFIVLAAATF